MKSIDRMPNLDVIFNDVIQVVIKEGVVDSLIVAKKMELDTNTAITLLQRLSSRGYLIGHRSGNRTCWKLSDWCRRNDITTYDPTRIPGCDRYFVAPEVARSSALILAPDLREKFGAENPAKAKALYKTHRRSATPTRRGRHASKSA